MQSKKQGFQPGRVFDPENEAKRVEGVSASTGRVIDTRQASPSPLRKSDEPKSLLDRYSEAAKMPEKDQTKDNDKDRGR